MSTLETGSQSSTQANDHLIISDDPHHPANHICTLCRNFYNLGWVTGTGGGTSIRRGPHIFIAPSGVQKELMQPENIFVLDYATRFYLRKPPVLKPSACTPLFMAGFDRGAGCCIQSVRYCSLIAWCRGLMVAVVRTRSGLFWSLYW